MGINLESVTGDELYAVKRFAPQTSHMVIFEVLDMHRPRPWDGRLIRRYCDDRLYARLLNAERQRQIKILYKTDVIGGYFVEPKKNKKKRCRRQGVETNYGYVQN